jgi:hypothetical protein
VSRGALPIGVGIRPLPSRAAAPAATPRWLRVARDYQRYADTTPWARPRVARVARIPLPGFPRARVAADGAGYATPRWTGRTSQHRRRYRHHPAHWGAEGGGPF